jgi:hypothetical protein
MKNKIYKLVLASFLTTLVFPEFSYCESALDQASKAGTNSPLAFDGNKNAGYYVDLQSEINKKLEEAKKAAVKPAEPSFFENSIKDISKNKADYAIMIGAGALAGYLLFGGIMGPLGVAAFLTIFMLVNRNL